MGINNKLPLDGRESSRAGNWSPVERHPAIDPKLTPAGRHPTYDEASSLPRYISGRLTRPDTVGWLMYLLFRQLY